MGGQSSKGLENEDISETQLWRVSEKVMPGLQDKLADILGLRSEEMNEIRHASDLSCPSEATLKMLLRWQVKQTTTNKAASLTKVLKELDLWEKGLIRPGEVDHLKYVVSSKKAKQLTELQLRCVGNRIPNEKYVPVGLFLGLPYKRVAAEWIAAGAHVKAASFRMLCAWQRDVAAGQTDLSQPETLAKVLETTNQGQLADQVAKGIGLKINHYEMRHINLKAVQLKKYLGLDEAGVLHFVQESEDMVEKERYGADLHIFNVSKTDKIEGSPALICFSDKCMRMDDTGCLSAQTFSFQARQLSQVNDWFFLHQTLDDGSFVLMSCQTPKYVCASGTSPALGSLEDALHFQEESTRRR